MSNYLDMGLSSSTARQVSPADTSLAGYPGPAEPAASNEQKIRLLKFMTNFGVGGTEKQVAALAANLDREQFNLSFACLRRKGEVMIRQIERSGARIDEYPIPRLYGYRAWRRREQFSRALGANRIQIMHSYNFYANVFAIPAAKRARVPCVVASVRDLGVYLSPIKRWIQAWNCRRADIVLVNAEAIRRWMLAQGVPSRKLRVIHNGVDTEKFNNAAGGLAFRRELCIPDDAPLIVMLARLHPKKGIDYLLQAAPAILARHPDAYFAVVGEAYHRKDGTGVSTTRRKLQARAAELGVAAHFFFPGKRDDVPEILSTATISAHPSLSEGLSNALLESMAAGTAVVATTVGGTPEAIRDGHDGLLIEPGDSEAIANAVCTILEDPSLAERLGDQARARAVAEFSLQAMVQKTEATYLELMASKRRNNEPRRRTA